MYDGRAHEVAVGGTGWEGGQIIAVEKESSQVL